MKGLNLDLLPLGFYSFLLLLSLFLAGTVGGPLTALAAFLLFFLLADILQVVITATGIRIKEDISSDHPVKGQMLDYSLVLEADWLPFRSSRMDLEFLFSNPSARAGERITLWLGAGGKKKVERRFPCRFRGNYSLGLSTLEVRSWTGWIIWSLDLWPRTFYVLPRVTEISGRLPLPPYPGEGSPALIPDNSLPSLYDHTAPYRDGIPLKYVDWKPLARGSDPVARHYLPESWNHVNLYVDLSRPRDLGDFPGEDILEGEDLGVEAAASLLSALALRSIPAACHTWAGSTGPITDGNFFQEWLQSTVQWKFKPSPSLAALWKSRGQEGAGTGDIFITHRLDPELWELVASLRGEDRVLIAVMRSWTPEEKALWAASLEALQQTGARVWEVGDLEDLRRFHHG